MDSREARAAGREMRPAFTIIELLIVMVIIGLVVAFAGPNIDPTRFKVNSSMQVLGTTMLTVQRQAITQQHDIILQIDTAQHRLRIHEDEDNDGSIDAVAVEVERIGEGQRFVTQLLAERGEAVPAALPPAKPVR